MQVKLVNNYVMLLDWAQIPLPQNICRFASRSYMAIQDCIIKVKLLCIITVGLLIFVDNVFHSLTLQYGWDVTSIFGITPAIEIRSPASISSSVNYYTVDFTFLEMSRSFIEHTCSSIVTGIFFFSFETKSTLHLYIMRFPFLRA